jgi:hypothetical protein
LWVWLLLLNIFKLKVLIYLEDILIWNLIMFSRWHQILFRCFIKNQVFLESILTKKKIIFLEMASTQNYFVFTPKLIKVNYDPKWKENGVLVCFYHCVIVLFVIFFFIWKIGPTLFLHSFNLKHTSNKLHS